MKTLPDKFWISISLFNLCIVAALGVLMRYKIGFEFLYFNQKYLQEGHSHFAFLGWITQTLLFLITLFLRPHVEVKRQKVYQLLLLLHLTFAYFILVTLTSQGYGILYFFFLTLSLVVFTVFSVACFRDFGKMDKSNASIPWLKASMLFFFISTAGIFGLAYMALNKYIPPNADLMAEYWYLHFQYNGWFFFASIGLFLNFVHQKFPEFKVPSSIFWLFAFSGLAAFGLSVLWLKLPVWIYAIVFLGALLQMLAWLKLLSNLKRIGFLKSRAITVLGKILFGLVALSLTIKFGLQLGSTVPAISQLAFGFRPIVIAYLHLVLLAIFSVFLLCFFYTNQLMKIGKWSFLGLLVFVGGVYINEIILAIQGIASLSYHLIPRVNYMLFGASLFLFFGVLLLLVTHLYSSRSK